MWTYFQDFGTPSSALHAEILKVFTKNWASQGYMVEVLSESDAKKHPDYRKFKRRVSRYPTTNSREYETACFLRWLALNVAKGQLQSDYDVLNISFDSDAYSKTIKDHKYFDLRIVNFDAHLVPCAVHIEDAIASDALINILMSKNLAKTAQSTINGKPHISDMHMFQGLRIGDSIPVCHLAEMNFPLKHFSTNSTGGLEAKLNTMRSAANF